MPPRRLWSDRILYFKWTANQIVKKITLRPEDWAGRPREPAKMDYEPTTRPHSIAAVLLD